MEYDWRARFRKPLTIIGTDKMTWGEALRLVKVLRKDTTSAITAALEGWDFPTSREHLAMLDLFDVTVMANSDTKKGRPSLHGGRPVPINNHEVLQRGNTSGRSRAEVVELLDRARQGLPV